MLSNCSAIPLHLPLCFSQLHRVHVSAAAAPFSTQPANPTSNLAALASSPSASGRLSDADTNALLLLSQVWTSVSPHTTAIIAIVQDAVSMPLHTQPLFNPAATSEGPVASSLPDDVDRHRDYSAAQTFVSAALATFAAGAPSPTAIRTTTTPTPQHAKENPTDSYVISG
jgi:hypothetical protein